MNNLIAMLSSMSKMASAPPEELIPFKDIPIIESTKFDEPSNSRALMGGVQKIWRFKNGYGADVVRHAGSYGSSSGLWELAVLKFTADGSDWDLTYDTDITDDVIGYLNESEVEEYLKQVKALEVKQ